MIDCRELRFDDQEAVLARAESEPDLLAFIDRVAARVSDEITRAETIARSQRDAAIARQNELAHEVSELRSRRDRPPKPPATRTADRAVMTGAPFWQIVDFAPAVPDSVRGPIEAALLAAGLLDAWVGPAGQVQGHDTFADPAMLAPVPGRSLADVLIPEPDSPVPAEIVRRLLSAIAFDDQLPLGDPAGIGADGTWRLGNAHGSWHQDHPAHIGASARERARQERLRELAQEIDSIEQVIAGFDADLAALRARRDTLANERAVRPGSSGPDRGGAGGHAGGLRPGGGRHRGPARGRDGQDQVRPGHGGAAAADRARFRASAADRSRGARTLSAAIGRFQLQAENWLDEVSALAPARQLLVTLSRPGRALRGRRRATRERGDRSAGQS